MKRILLSAHIVIIVLLLTACGGGSKTSSFQLTGDTLSLRYASNLTLIETKEYTQAILRNPWDTTKVLENYILVENNRPLPSKLPQGTVVRTPLNRMLIYTTVHCSLMDDLHRVDKIAGVCELEYIKNPAVIKGNKEGRIIDVGSGMNPDIEKIINLNPDALFISPFENSGGFGKVEKLGVPIIQCADYMETSPLGRAEWMRFFGRLVGQASFADSLFHSIETRYLKLKELALSTSERPSLLSEVKSGSAWYVPGGNSYVGKLYNDAGGNYAFSHLPQSGSVPLSFETVFEQAQQADFWFLKYNQTKDKTRKELKQDYALNARFKAFQEKKMYGCNTRYANYYEDLPFHPDFVLKDLVKILHPDLLPEHELQYFKLLAD